jgi:hypothetical protein
MYVAGEPDNARDGLLNSIHDARARASLIAALLPTGGATHALSGRFDLVLAADGRLALAEPGLLERTNRRSICCSGWPFIKGASRAHVGKHSFIRFRGSSH